VDDLLRDWDDARAAALFAMNVELDEPLASRRATIEALRARHGTLRPDPDEPTESNTAFHLAWWLAGDRGRVRAEILLSPELPPRVQALTLTSVPEPPPALRAAADQVVAALASCTAGRLPILTDLPLSDAVDRAALTRSLRAADARFGGIRLGKPVAGDGEKAATFRMDCERGKLELAMTWDPEARVLTAVSLVPARLAPPDFD
jgi:hypothetical protein